MINGTEAIHIMDGNKISKQFITAFIVMIGFISIIGYIVYISLHNYDFFLETVKEQKMTLVRVEEPITARNNSCAYQVHFEAIDSLGQKVRARYCGGYYFHGKINIKEIIKK